MIENIGEKSQIIKLINQSQTKDEFKTLLTDLVNLLVVDNVDINQLKKIIGCSLFPNENINENTNDKENLENLEQYIKNSESKKYTPSTKFELIDLINELMDKNGCDCDLNCIDTSKITDMSYLFTSPELRLFNGNISEWDVSNVKDMSHLFEGSAFDKDISKWNVSNVKDMSFMFYKSYFTGDISKWNVSNVKNMSYMFGDAYFDNDISDWNVSNVEDMSCMFSRISLFDLSSNVWDSDYDINQLPKEWNRGFKQDISKWTISNTCNTTDMFAGSPLVDKPEYRPKIKTLQ